MLDDVQQGKKPKAINIIIKDKPTKNLREKILHEPNDAPMQMDDKRAYATTQ